MTARRARYARIATLAETILRECGIFAPPVPIKEIILGRGVEIRHGDLGEISGLLVRLPENAVIGVNSKQAPVRQRFTMAHEFGHLLLHEGLKQHSDTSFKVNYRDRTSSEATDVDEVEANFFAACILMPRIFLDQAKAIEALDDDAAVYELAEKFNVSQHAMSLRLANEYGRFRPF